MIPVAPLWGFFSHIRGRSPVPLSIEQYFYLVHAIHSMDLQHIKTSKDLLEFTKIFWLNNPRFKEQYEHAFTSFLDWEKVLNTPVKQEAITTPVVSPVIDPVPEKKEGKEKVAEEGRQEAIPKELQVKESTSLVDFDLLVKETESDLGFENPSMTPVPQHDFSLSDLAIVPFDGRHFVQRLRRKVETTEQIYSDVLDLPMIVERFAEMGFIDDFIYEIYETQQSNVVLLSDRSDSMLSFEFLERHFELSLRQIPYCHFEHYFFYNWPREVHHGNHFELQPAKKGQESFDTIKHKWNKNTWFLLLSDAGAFSGIVNLERIKQTMNFWKYLQSITEHVHWINPVPNEYMEDCTASRLQISIPMTHPDKDSMKTQILQRNTTPL